MDGLKPTEKVQAGGYGGAAAVLALYLLGRLGVELPAAEAAAVSLLVAGAAAYLKREGAGWFARGRGKRAKH